MSRSSGSIPHLLPVLSRGRHRSPRSGACFMEFASFLAGERWSDHPACTHPSLASLARIVNDCSSPAARAELVTLIPSVVGLVGNGTRTGVSVAVAASIAALPIASESRQRAIAAGLIRIDELLSDNGESAGSRERARITAALSETSAAASWAKSLVDSVGSLNPRAVPTMIEAIIRTATIGIAEACVTDPDARLKAVLEDAIAVSSPGDAVTAQASQELVGVA